MTTKAFKISTAKYILLIVGLLFRRWAWIFAIPFVVAIVLSFSDLRFLIVALMILFVVVPLSLMFIYIYFGLTPQARFSILEKTLDINKSYFSAEFKSISEDCPTPPSVRLKLSRITDVSFRKDCYVITIDNSRYRPIVIPYNAFSSPDDLREFSSYILKK